AKARSVMSRAFLFASNRNIDKADRYNKIDRLGIQGQRKGVVIATKKQAKVECTRVPSANGWKVYLKARKTKAPENISV
ncbi:hypothetical protein ACVSTU_23020, partial [Yersinia enterocolitica]